MDWSVVTAAITAQFPMHSFPMSYLATHFMDQFFTTQSNQSTITTYINAVVTLLDDTTLKEDIHELLQWSFNDKKESSSSNLSKFSDIHKTIAEAMNQRFESFDGLDVDLLLKQLNTSAFEDFVAQTFTLQCKSDHDLILYIVLKYLNARAWQGNQVLADDIFVLMSSTAYSNKVGYTEWIETPIYQLFDLKDLPIKEYFAQFELFWKYDKKTLESVVCGFIRRYSRDISSDACLIIIKSLQYKHLQKMFDDTNRKWYESISMTVGEYAETERK
eukprot:125294_1